MNLSHCPDGTPSWAEVLVYLVVLVWGCWQFGCWFSQRWDRLTRHRFRRWHRQAWRDETQGHAAIYGDAICRCCRRFQL
jgi:hypothetical protein